MASRFSLKKLVEASLFVCEIKRLNIYVEFGALEILVAPK